MQVKILASTLGSQINGVGVLISRISRGIGNACVCVCVCVCVLGRCVCGWGVEYLGDEGQKMVNRVPLRLM